MHNSIEDLETSYYPWLFVGGWNKTPGGPPGTPGTTIGVVKSLLDVLNRDFVAGPSYSTSHFVIGGGNLSLFDGDDTLASVHCFRNMCALRKQRGGEFVVGEEQGCSHKTRRPTLNAKVPCAS